jgi:hypothetical protein
MELLVPGIMGCNMERDSKLNEVFDVAPMPKAEVILTPLDDEEKDLQNVRKINYELIEKAKDALDNLIDFAKASESPRAYEVVANLIKTTSDVAKNISDMSSKTQKPETQNNTQNNIFIGSTAELQKLLKNDFNS